MWKESLLITVVFFNLVVQFNYALNEETRSFGCFFSMAASFFVIWKSTAKWRPDNNLPIIGDQMIDIRNAKKVLDGKIEDIEHEVG